MKINRDFTLKIYQNLLSTALKSNYKISPLREFSDLSSVKKLIILKHDVDRNHLNALKMAQIENDLGVKSSYYFRIFKESYSESTIKSIAKLGHEIGFHYEELSTTKGDFKKAIELFNENLSKIRTLYPVETICMHGSPMSKWDNKLLWERYNYRDFGIVADPFFDINFKVFFYLTDTGRSWNNSSISVRDKVTSNYSGSFDSTIRIIERILDGKFPNKVVINVHPHRWHNEVVPWSNEFIFQKFKNLIKKYLILRRNFKSGYKEK